MESESEIVLESAAATGTDSGRPASRALPFSFAKRHGVLFRTITPDAVDTVCRKEATALSLAEAQRFAGVPLKLSRVSAEVFDALQQES